MSLPRALNTSLNRFQKSASVIQKVFADKNTYAGGETAVINLPTSGVLDMDSLILCAQQSYVNGATAGTYQQLYRCIRRLELVVNGQTIFGDQLTDYATAVELVRRVSRPDYKNTSTSCLKVYEETSGTIAASATTTVDGCHDLPQFFKSMRFVPLSAFGPMQLRISWDFSKVGTSVTNTSSSILNPYVLCRIYQMENNLYDQLIAQRIAQEPLEISVAQWANSQGSTFTTAGTFNITTSQQSLDYILYTARLSATASGTAWFTGEFGGTTGSIQVSVNGVPQSSAPLSLMDCFLTTIEAMDGLSENILANPSLGTTAATYNQGTFVLAHRLKFHSMGDEEDHLISGMSSYGSQIPIAITHTTPAGSYVPVAVLVGTSTVELSGGRVLRKVM